MEHKPALYALLRLHAELGGKIKDNAREAETLRESMLHVEAVLHLLEPGFNARTIAPRRRNKPNPLFKKGATFPAAMGVLRCATEPMSAYDIARVLLRQKGIAEPSKDEVDLLYSAVSSSLRNYDGKNVKSDDGRPKRWRVLD